MRRRGAPQLMTEQQRNHLIRMVKHAEKVKRNMDNLRRTNDQLTPEETAKVMKGWKKKYPDFFTK
jgi:hypothetical protein